MKITGGSKRPRVRPLDPRPAPTPVNASCPVPQGRTRSAAHPSPPSRNLPADQPGPDNSWSGRHHCAGAEKIRRGNRPPATRNCSTARRADLGQAKQDEHPCHQAPRTTLRPGSLEIAARTISSVIVQLPSRSRGDRVVAHAAPALRAGCRGIALRAPCRHLPEKLPGRAVKDARSRSSPVPEGALRNHALGVLPDIQAYRCESRGPSAPRVTLTSASRHADHQSAHRFAHKLSGGSPPCRQRPLSLSSRGCSGLRVIDGSVRTDWTTRHGVPPSRTKD